MKLLGQRLAVAVLLAISVLALGARQTVLAQETDDLLYFQFRLSTF